MPSACDAAERERRSVRGGETFSQRRGSVSSFLYAMWPECLTDDLTGEDEELRFAWPVLTLLASRVVFFFFFLHPLPSPAISMPPYTPKITALRAFLQASVVQTLLCAPSSTSSNLGSSLCCHFDCVSVSTYHLFAALPFILSLSLRHFFPCTEVTVTLSKPVHLLTPSPLL